MHTLASTIRNRIDTLAEEYDRGLRAIGGYAELPDQDRFEAARCDLELIAACLETGDAAEFTQFIQTKAGERMAQDFELESLLQALTAFEEILQPMVTTVEAATFLWQALSQARTIVSRIATERVRASEQKFKFLADSIAVGIFIYQDGLVRYIGREGARILGYDSLDGLIGRSIMDFIHPSERERTADIARRRVAGEPVPDQYETRLLKKDGTAIDVLIYGGLIEYEGRVATQGAFIEITERKRSEESLRRLERAVEQSIDGVAVADMDGNIQFVNPTWAQMHGYTTEELQGKHLSIFHTEEQLQEDVIPFNERVMEFGAHQGEVGHVRRGGTTFLTWMTTTLLKDERENPIGLVGTARDITELKQLEREREELSERRAEQVRTSTEVAQEIAAAPVLDELFRRVVTLIKERFGYYHAQIFRYELAVNAVVLVTGYGEVGQKMLAEGHRLEMGRGVVGAAAATGQPVLATDVTQDPDWVPHPHLPETKGELAVPIILRRAQDGELHDQVLGILDVQSDRVGALTEEDQLLLEGLCGQIAIAIEDTRLHQEMEEKLRELEDLYHAMSREGWEALRRKARPTGYLFDRTDVITAGDSWVPEIGLAIERQALVPPTSDGQPVAVTPLSVRGEVIGALGVQDDPQHPLSPDDLALVESVSEQVALALESARLFERTQETLAETSALYEAGRAIAEASTIEEILQAIVDNVIAPDVDRCSVFFNNTTTGQVEWMELAAAWDRAGVEGMPIGTRYPVEQFPIIRLLSKDKLFVVNNAAEDEQLGAMAREIAERLQAQSFALAPLATPEHWLGLLMITCRSPYTFTERELRLYQSVADRAAIAIENRRLLEQTQAQARRERLIREITGQVQRSINLDAILQTTVQELGKALSASHAVVRLGTEAELAMPTADKAKPQNKDKTRKEKKDA